MKKMKRKIIAALRICIAYYTWIIVIKKKGKNKIATDFNILVHLLRILRLWSHLSLIERTSHMKKYLK